MLLNVVGEVIHQFGLYTEKSYTFVVGVITCTFNLQEILQTTH